MKHLSQLRCSFVLYDCGKGRRRVVTLLILTVAYPSMLSIIILLTQNQAVSSMPQFTTAYGDSITSAAAFTGEHRNAATTTISLQQRKNKHPILLSAASKSLFFVPSITNTTVQSNTDLSHSRWNYNTNNDREIVTRRTTPRSRTHYIDNYPGVDHRVNAEDHRRRARTLSSQRQVTDDPKLLTKQAEKAIDDLNEFSPVLPTRNGHLRSTVVITKTVPRKSRARTGQSTSPQKTTLYLAKVPVAQPSLKNKSPKQPPSGAPTIAVVRLLSTTPTNISPHLSQQSLKASVIPSVSSSPSASPDPTASTSASPDPTASTSASAAPTPVQSQKNSTSDVFDAVPFDFVICYHSASQYDVAAKDVEEVVTWTNVFLEEFLQSIVEQLVSLASSGTSHEFNNCISYSSIAFFYPSADFYIPTSQDVHDMLAIAMESNENYVNQLKLELSPNNTFRNSDYVTIAASTTKGQGTWSAENEKRKMGYAVVIAMLFGIGVIAAVFGSYLIYRRRSGKGNEVQIKVQSCSTDRDERADLSSLTSEICEEAFSTRRRAAAAFEANRNSLHVSLQHRKRWKNQRNAAPLATLEEENDEDDVSKGTRSSDCLDLHSPGNKASKNSFAVVVNQGISLDGTAMGDVAKDSIDDDDDDWNQLYALVSASSIQETKVIHTDSPSEVPLEQEEEVLVTDRNLFCQQRRTPSPCDQSENDTEEIQQDAMSSSVRSQTNVLNQCSSEKEISSSSIDQLTAAVTPASPMAKKTLPNTTNELSESPTAVATSWIDSHDDIANFKGIPSVVPSSSFSSSSPQCRLSFNPSGSCTNLSSSETDPSQTESGRLVCEDEIALGHEDSEKGETHEQRTRNLNTKLQAEQCGNDSREDRLPGRESSYLNQTIPNNLQDDASSPPKSDSSPSSGGSRPEYLTLPDAVDEANAPEDAVLYRNARAMWKRLEAMNFSSSATVPTPKGKVTSSWRKSATRMPVGADESKMIAPPDKNNSEKRDEVGCHIVGTAN